MDIEVYREYCLSKKQATEGLPFPSLPHLLVFKVGGKIFAITDILTFASITICCPPEKINELREAYAAVIPAPYLSNRHWNKIIMNNSIPDNLILEWTDISYRLTVEKLTKKVKKELNL